ncbi:MAG: cell surface protein [Bacteroidales bacterium]|nr:cell surface protein [Bacteroidales bacterium]
MDRFFKVFIRFVIVLAAAAFLCRCGGKPLDVNPKPAPSISVESQAVTVKVGKSITITPTYTNADGASFQWTMDGKVISTAKSLTFSSKETGIFYAKITVTNSNGSASMEIKITVAEMLPPRVAMAVPQGGFSIQKDTEHEFIPSVENDEGCSYSWTLDNAEVATTKSYKYKPTATGTHTFKFTAKNEDGQASLSFTVKVLEEKDMPFKWSFERETYNYSTGRSIRILIRDLENAFDAKFVWTLDGTEVQNSALPYYVCSEATIGKHTLTVTMKNSFRSQSKTLTVNVCQPEGTYKRTGGTAPWNKIYEYMPAPGQFINEGFTAGTMEEACAWAQKRMEAKTFVSLGAWGGYITAGFDHSIENDGGYNIAIAGNAFHNSSEPGIVWVMQDENGNGLPDDTWYELKGSDYAYETKDYAITYYKPNAKSSVMWTSSDGKSGSVDYLAAYHSQDFYYPNWVKTSSYTLYGSKLISRTKEVSKDSWINQDFDWGYVDNYSEVDRLSSDNNSSGGASDNHFKISDAVRWDGQPANLKYMDFIKIQTAVCDKAGWIGEVSTEILFIADYNMSK